MSYVRELFKYFRKSPLKMSELQKIIKLNHGKELALLLDVKTRWNSVLPMVRRYLVVKKDIVKALEMFNDGQLYTIRHDEALQELSDSLGPVEVSVTTLSKHSSNLIVAEAAIKYVVESLETFQSKLATDLVKAVTDRYSARRNKQALSLMLFLHTGSYPHADSKPGFEYSSKADIKRFANALSERLFSHDATAAAPIEDPQEEDEPTGSHNLSIQDKIDELMKPTGKPTASANLDKDIKLFEATKEKSQRLEKLYNALFSIQPTSTSCEQAFSVTGSFKTKVRNRLEPNNLKVLAWLSSYFANFKD